MTQFVVIVTDTQTRAFDVRTVTTSLEAGKEYLGAEVRRAGKPELEWTDEFGGSITRQAGLEYEIRPVYSRT